MSAKWVLFPAALGMLCLAGCGGSNGYTASDKDMTPYVVKISGDNQTATAGNILTSRFTVQLRMDAGQFTSWNLRQVTFKAPTTGASGTFTAPTTGASGAFIVNGEPNVVSGGDYYSVTVLSGPDGLVSSPQFQTNALTGTYEVTVEAFPTFYPDKPGTVKFKVTNQ